MAEIFEVSQINEYLRQRFEADEFLGSLLIRGELSNYKIYPSGHHYFTLKDSQSAIEFAVATSALKHSIEGDFNRVTVAEVEKPDGRDGDRREQP